MFEFLTTTKSELNRLKCFNGGGGSQIRHCRQEFVRRGLLTILQLDVSMYILFDDSSTRICIQTRDFFFIAHFVGHRILSLVMTRPFPSLRENRLGWSLRASLFPGPICAEHDLSNLDRYVCVVWILFHGTFGTLLIWEKISTERGRLHQGIFLFQHSNPFFSSLFLMIVVYL